MTHCRQSAVRHHRGSAAVAICGAGIHDRGNVAKELSAVRHHRRGSAVKHAWCTNSRGGNLQHCESAIGVERRCELLAMVGGKIDWELAHKGKISDLRGRVSDSHRHPATNHHNQQNREQHHCYPLFVPRIGLEPTRLSTLAPETSASTISPSGL